MKSLYSHCTSAGIKAPADSVYVFAESVLYLVGATGAFQFQRHIKPLCRLKSAKVFRLHLRNNLYTNLTLKLYVRHLIIIGATEENAETLAKQYEIPTVDYKLIYTLLIENLWFRKTLRAFCRAEKCSISDISQDTLTKTFNRIYPKIIGYIKHISWSKLRFMANSENMELHDFHSELSLKLVSAYYSIVPSKMSEQHMINYLKRIVHNHAINMIMSGTSQKNARLTSTEEDANGNRKYLSLCVSENQMPVSQFGENSDIEGSDNSAERFELQFSISEMLDSVKASSKDYRFLTLLLGAEDKEFSTYLKNSKICKEYEDNVDVQHRVGAEKYTELISQFLRVSKHRVDNLFESVKRQLAW